jgi:hypothetical protein
MQVEPVACLAYADGAMLNASISTELGYRLQGCATRQGELDDLQSVMKQYSANLACACCDDVRQCDQDTMPAVVDDCDFERHIDLH